MRCISVAISNPAAVINIRISDLARFYFPLKCCMGNIWRLDVIHHDVFGKYMTIGRHLSWRVWQIYDVWTSSIMTCLANIWRLDIIHHDVFGKYLTIVRHPSWRVWQIYDDWTSSIMTCSDWCFKRIYLTYYWNLIIRSYSITFIL